MSSPLFDRPVEDLNTRARIRDAAMSEFSDKGFNGATMRGIAAAAGVSVGLVQHHFGTKDGLRAACDERVLDMVRFKVEALADGTFSQPAVLGAMRQMAPGVQRYVGRALIEDSPQINAMVDDVMARGEEFLTDQWPERFPAGEQATIDAAAVVTAMNTSIMVLQSHLSRRMGFEPFSDEGIFRTGRAMFEVFEAFGDFARTELWRDLRATIDAMWEREGLR